MAGDFQPNRKGVSHFNAFLRALCVYVLQYPSLCTKAIHYRRGSSRTCVCVFCFCFFVFFWGGGLSAFLLVPMYGCLCLCMWMHVHPGSLIWNWIQLAAFRGSEEGEILPQLLINSGPGPQCAAPIHRLARGSWRKAVVLVLGQHDQVCGCESDLLAHT